MSSSAHPTIESEFLERAFEAAIRIGLVAVLAAWCFSIFRPFLNPLLWGLIIACAPELTAQDSLQHSLLSLGLARAA